MLSYFQGSDAHTPLGSVFSTFMVCIMLGSSCFTYLLHEKGLSAAKVLVAAVKLFAFSTLVCSLVAGPNPEGSMVLKACCLWTFMGLEVAIGLYFPSIGTLRSLHVPESHRATINNWFRLPMNLITCVTLLAVKHPYVAADKRCIFVSSTALLVVGIVLAEKFRRLVAKHSKE